MRGSSVKKRTVNGCNLLSPKMHQMLFVTISKEINMVVKAHTWGPETWKSEERGLPQDQGQPELQIFFKILPIEK